jgi:periplasmic divalent cation tolerance protein
MADEIIQVVTTTADKQDAETLAQALLTKRLAGCVQISGPIDSTYWWNGRLETGTEFTCTIKTLRSLYGEVERTLLELHPYDQPEILAIAVSDVSEGYAQWLREQVQPEYLAEQGGLPTPADAIHETEKIEAAESTQPAADITPAQAAEMIPAAGLAAASQSNVPQAAPFAAGDVESPGATFQPVHSGPSESTASESQRPTPGEKASSRKASKRTPRKKTSGPSF